MDESTNKSKIKGAVKILFGILMIVTAIIGYAPLPAVYYAEFTLITNALGGLLLFADGIMNLKGTGMPAVLYRNVCSGIAVVFLVCLATLATPNPFNFGGAFLFLHVINPLAIIFSYIFLCEDNGTSKIGRALTAPVLSIAYLLFDYILGKSRGFFVYGFFMPENLSLPVALIVGAVVFLLVMLIGLLLVTLNKKAHKNYEY